MNLRWIRAMGMLAGHYALQKVISRLRDPASERGIEAYHEKYADDGIYGLDPADRAAFPSYQACMTCRLCDLVCPIHDVPEGRAFAGPAAYAMSATRNLTEVDLWTDHWLCVRCGACEAVCPAGVPLGRLHDAVRRRQIAVRPDLLPEPVRGVLAGLKEVPLQGPDQGGATLLFRCACTGEPADAASRLLTRLGVEHATVSGACGGLSRDLGLPEPSPTALVDAIRFAGAQRIVCEEPRCARHLLELTTPEDGFTVEPLALSLLALDADELRAPEAGPVAVAPSDDLGHGLGLYALVADVLRAAGAEVVAPPTGPDDARADGSGAGLPETAPALATALAHRQLDGARSAGASVLVTAGTAAARHLRAARRPGDPEVRSLAEHLLLGLEAGS